MQVAVWVNGFEPAEMAIAWQGHICCKSAVICAMSADRAFHMKFPTNALTPELLQRLELLHRHGLTIVEVPEFWTGEISRPSNWHEQLTFSALDRADKLPEPPELGSRAPYDEALSLEVLTILEKSYPHPVNMIDIKRALAIEPSDNVLITALEALSYEEKIENCPPFGRARKLSATLEIRLTKEGRDEVKGIKQDLPHLSVTNGDLNINMGGNTGAMGRQSVGTINYQSQWRGVQAQVDLTMLAAELERLRTEYQKVASSREEIKQLVLLGDAAEDAEKGNGEGMAAHLSRIGTNVLRVAQDIGTDIAAKVIVELTKE